MFNKYILTLTDIKSGQSVDLLALCHKQNPDMDECSSIESVAITRYDLPGCGMLADTVDDTYAKYMEAGGHASTMMKPSTEGDRYEHILSETRGGRIVELALVNTQTGVFKSFGGAAKIVLEVSLVNLNLR